MTVDDPSPENGGDHAAKSSLTPEQREDLKQRLNLGKEQQEMLAKLSEAELERWYLMLERWSSPEQRLAAIESEINSKQPVPAFRIPTAEGVSTYRGIFGGNGSLTEDDQALVLELLEEEINRSSTNGHGSNGNGNGHHAPTSDHEESEEP